VGNRKGHEVTIYHGQDRRRLLPQAVVLAISELIRSQREGSGLTSSVAELVRVRTMLCHMYNIDDPSGVARETDVMQHLAEEDGDEIQTLV